MNAHFSVQADPARDLLRIELAGFFAPEDMANLYATYRDERARLVCGPNQHLTLADLREMKVQAQEIVAYFRALLANPADRARRIAVVTTPSLLRSQILRALNGRDAHLFDDPQTAEHWLLGADSVASAA